MTSRASDTSDIRAAAGVASRGLAETTSIIRDTHRAVSRRIFTLTGRGRPRPTPTRLLHDGISEGVYAAIGAGMTVVGAVAGHGAAVATELHSMRTGKPTLALADTRQGGFAIGALNGAWGDWLHGTGSPLALGMSVRKDHRDVPLTADALAASYDDAGPHISVWLHGLCETEQSWWLDAEEWTYREGRSHGDRLQQLSGITPIYLRYNSGRHISHNGAELNDLLTALVEFWPVPVESVMLVGHSMGGLVIRSACSLGQAGDAPWTHLVDRALFLGAPHLGAPLEVAAARARRVLGKLPETEPLGRALASRSVGIKDLRHGSLLDGDWSELDFEGWLAEPESCEPLLANVEHFFIGATIARDKDSRSARTFGDALVTWSSASGRNTRRDLKLLEDNGRHLGGLHHFDLLNHPRVWSVIEAWFCLTSDGPALAATATE